MWNMLMRLIMVVAVLLAVYFFFYIKRSVEFYIRKPIKELGKLKRWIIRILCAAAAAGLAYMCRNAFGVQALVVLHIAAASLVMDLVNKIIKIVRKHKKAGNKIENKESEKAADTTKTAEAVQGAKKNIWDMVYRCGLMPIIIMIVVLAYGSIHMSQIYEENYTIETQKEIRQEGYTVAFLSDLHFGTTMDEEKLSQQCARISEENPDFVILGGDIVDESTTLVQMQATFRELSKIKSTYGVYYVYGNHDRATYSANSDFNAQQLEQTILESGIIILQDESVVINGELTLIGREDRSRGGRLSIDELLEGVDMGTFILVADHQPQELAENAQAGVDMEISGHTHGGQIFPVGLVSELAGFGELNYGQKSFDDMEAIVSSGIAGWGYAIRTGSNSEFVIVDIVPSK